MDQEAEFNGGCNAVKNDLALRACEYKKKNQEFESVTTFNATGSKKGRGNQTMKPPAHGRNRTVTLRPPRGNTAAGSEYTRQNSSRSSAQSSAMGMRKENSVSSFQQVGIKSGLRNNAMRNSAPNPNDLANSKRTKCEQGGHALEFVSKVPERYTQELDWNHDSHLNCFDCGKKIKPAKGFFRCDWACNQDWCKKCVAFNADQKRKAKILEINSSNNRGKATLNDLCNKERGWASELDKLDV